MDNVRLVACDLDGTLLLADGVEPPGMWDYVKKLNDRDITFVPASGRPLTTLKAMFDKPNFELALISDNGAIVYHQGELVYCSVMTKDQYLPMVTLTQEATDGIPVVCGVQRAFAPTKARTMIDELSVYYLDIVFTDDFESIDEDVVKYSAYFPAHDARQAYEETFEPLLSKNFSVTLGGHPWVDIMNKGVTKGHALEMLADRLGLERSNLMAFGDALNDVEMLAAVEHSVAMDNAVPEVLAQARRRTSTNEEFGVYQVLDELLSR